MEGGLEEGQEWSLCEAHTTLLFSRAAGQAPEQTGSPLDSHSGIRAAGFLGSLKYLFDPSISRVRTKTSPAAI